MHASDLDAAIAEAQRFIERAKALKAAWKVNETRQFKDYRFPERSAVVRSSMDLTRALAQLRRV